MKDIEIIKSNLRWYIRENFDPKTPWLKNLDDTTEEILKICEVVEDKIIYPFMGTIDEAPEEIKADLKDLAKDKIESDLTDHTS